ncbi:MULTISPECIES: hypothetical protein [Bacillus cereus group]|nr:MULTISPECIES: hypothetical protein [Bacillus cereus group]MED2693793.1 hypothetical protein [Bacillus toyonensis]
MLDIILSILAGTLGMYIFLRIFKIDYPWFSLVIGVTIHAHQLKILK